MSNYLKQAVLLSKVILKDQGVFALSTNVCAYVFPLEMTETE